MSKDLRFVRMLTHGGSVARVESRLDLMVYEIPGGFLCFCGFGWG